MSKIHRITIKDASKHHKYPFHNLFLYSPHPLYHSQHAFIDYVIKCLNQKQNALIQSPTGTGKTLSLLCSTIAWAMDIQQTTGKEPPQIIYASRTHAQLKQVAAQISKLCYNIKLSILSSRDQSCVNQDLKLLRGQDKQLQCRLRMAQKKGLSCQFYQNEGYYHKQVELGKLMDLQQISLKGKLQKFCPFFYERHSKTIANIVLIPYNYLFDRKVWANQEGVRLQGSIVILDEAHNIQSVCQQFREFSINLSTLNRAMCQLNELRQQKLNQNKKKLDPVAAEKTKMLKIQIQDIQINAQYIQHIYEHLQTLQINADSTGLLLSSSQFCTLLENATQKGNFKSILNHFSKMTERFQFFRSDLVFYPYWALENWMKFVQKLLQLSKDRESGLSQFKIQILYEGADIRINIICLDPSSGFKDVIQQHKPRSIILTSGTLSPLKAWPLELKVDFASPLSCKHQLSPKQTQTVILGVGHSGAPLDTRFENRKNQQLYEDIGNALYQIVRHTPNGVVALFPSYSFLQQTKSHLSTQKILTKLYGEKNIYFQRKDSSDFANILERYLKEAQSTKGALLCALIRGKIAEGLDFSHKKCRAVVLVGVPYPCSKDVKVVAKMNYLNIQHDRDGKKGINGAQWYLSQTIRAINQGIGRLIRSPDDFGSVYLLDTRFCKPDIEAQLASWARMNLLKPQSFSEFVQKIRQINKISDSQIQLSKDQNLTSIKGASLHSQQIMFPQKSIRQSISRPVTEVDIKQKQKKEGLSLQDLMFQIKSQKEVADLQKKNNQISKELFEKQQKSKLSYERQIFKRNRVQTKKSQSGQEQCPICQVESKMVKSNTCHHAMCQQCWDKWLTQDLRCPICRGRVRRKFLVQQQ